MDIEKIGILKAIEWGINPSHGPIVCYKKNEIVYFKDVPGTKEEVEYMFKCFLDRGIAMDYVGDARKKEEKKKIEKVKRDEKNAKKKLEQEDDNQKEPSINMDLTIEDDEPVKEKRKYTKRKNN